MPPRKPKQTRPRHRRRALIGACVLAASAAGLWVGIHRVPWLGPALADGARDLVGPAPVAWAEDVTYGAADQVNLWLYGDAAPTTFWEPAEGPAPEVAPAEAAPFPDAKAAPASEPPRFPPPAFAPPFEKVASTGDGAWIPIADGEPGVPVLHKTVVHPDPKRPFAAIAVVAIDLDRLDLHMLAGTSEPESQRVPREKRVGLIPRAQHDDLVAAFNGGFKAVHGHYGMMLDGDTYVVPRGIACTLAFGEDGSLRIGTWSALEPDAASIVAYRQMPPCLVEAGRDHVGLGQEYNKNWGAAVDGETIIRRSAIGLDASRKTLFYGLGEAVTAQSLGRGMRAIGAADVAELDINYSYPRFLFFGHEGDAPRVTSGLIRDLKWKAEDYVIEPSTRDFFYLTRKRTTS